MSKPDVSFIGLGAMGFGMATHLVKQGFRVTGFDVWPPTLERFSAAGGLTASSPSTAVVDKPVCVCMVATHLQAQEVLVDRPDAAVKALPKGAVILLCSTVSCGYVQQLAAQLADPNGSVRRPDLLLVDCPVSGGSTRAADGTLSIMAGASEAALASAAGREVLAAMSDPEKLYVFPGGIGSGSNAKMVHQVLAVAQILAASEAWGFASRLGLPATQATIDALMAKSGASWMFGHRAPRMLTNYQPLSSATTIFLKDAGIITSEARRLGFATPLASLVESVVNSGVARGYGPDDDSSLVRLYTEGAEKLPASDIQDPAAALNLVVNLQKGIHLAAAAEALAFAHHVGLDLDQILGLCIHAAGGSKILEAHGPDMVSILRIGAPSGTTSKTNTASTDTLASLYDDLSSAIGAAQKLKIPVYLAGQSLQLIRLALNTLDKNLSEPAPSYLIKLWQA